MIIIYESEQLFDAQMVLDELLAAGMKAHLSGGLLSGAVGELPPTEAMVKVWLHEPKHQLRARQLVDTIEAARKKHGPDTPCKHCGEMLSPQFERCWQCNTWVVDA